MAVLARDVISVPTSAPEKSFRSNFATVFARNRSAVLIMSSRRQKMDRCPRNAEDLLGSRIPPAGKLPTEPGVRM